MCYEEYPPQLPICVARMASHPPNVVNVLKKIHFVESSHAQLILVKDLHRVSDHSHLLP
jgi:hypothetical protein